MSPLTQASVSPLGNQRGEQHSLAGAWEGWGANSADRGESLALCTVYSVHAKDKSSSVNSESCLELIVSYMTIISPFSPLIVVKSLPRPPNVLIFVFNKYVYVRFF
jgi:hypothetical protein